MEAAASPRVNGQKTGMAGLTGTTSYFYVYCFIWVYLVFCVSVGF